MAGGGDHKRRVPPAGGGGRPATKHRRSTATATSGPSSGGGRPAPSGVFVICGRCGKANHIRCAYCKACFLSKVDMGAAAAAASAEGRRGAEGGRGGGGGGEERSGESRYPSTSRDRREPSRPSPPPTWVPPPATLTALGPWVAPPRRACSPVRIPTASGAALPQLASTPWHPSTPPHGSLSQLTTVGPTQTPTPRVDAGMPKTEPLMQSSSPVTSPSTAWSSPGAQRYGGNPPPPASPLNARGLGQSVWGWPLMSSDRPPIQRGAATPTQEWWSFDSPDATILAATAAEATNATVVAGVHPASDVGGLPCIPTVPTTKAPSATIEAPDGVPTADSEVPPAEAALFALIVDELADAVPDNRVGDAVGGGSLASRGGTSCGS